MRQNRRHDFALTLFVASGFEHCIANLFVIPSPLPFAISPLPPSGNWRTVARQFSGTDGKPFYYRQSAPGVLGNIIGGAVLVSMCYRAIYYVRNPEKSARRNSSSG